MDKAMKRHPYTVTVRDIDPDIWLQIRKAALERGCLTGKIVNQALAAWLMKNTELKEMK
jgi:hypothetical protein